LNSVLSQIKPRMEFIKKQDQVRMRPKMTFGESNRRPDVNSNYDFAELDMSVEDLRARCILNASAAQLITIQTHLIIFLSNPAGASTPCWDHH